jgi:hypothetical protein
MQFINYTNTYIESKPKSLIFFAAFLFLISSLVFVGILFFYKPAEKKELACFVFAGDVGNADGNRVPAKMSAPGLSGYRLQVQKSYPIRFLYPGADTTKAAIYLADGNDAQNDTVSIWIVTNRPGLLSGRTLESVVTLDSPDKRSLFKQLTE